MNVIIAMAFFGFAAWFFSLLRRREPPPMPLPKTDEEIIVPVFDNIPLPPEVVLNADNSEPTSSSLRYREFIGANRFTAFDDLIARLIANIGAPFNLDELSFFFLDKAIITSESSWRPNVVATIQGRPVSVGLQQINLSNALAFQIIGTKEEQVRLLMDPETNISIGLRILKENVQRFGVLDGIAAYKVGTNIVKIRSGAAQVIAERVVRDFKAYEDGKTFNLAKLQEFEFTTPLFIEAR